MEITQLLSDLADNLASSILTVTSVGCDPIVSTEDDCRSILPSGYGCVAASRSLLKLNPLSYSRCVLRSRLSSKRFFVVLADETYLDDILRKSCRQLRIVRTHSKQFANEVKSHLQAMLAIEMSNQCAPFHPATTIPFAKLPEAPSPFNAATMHYQGQSSPVVGREIITSHLLSQLFPASRHPSQNLPTGKYFSS